VTGGSPKTKHHKEHPAFKRHAVHLGERVRSERASRGWTLEQAAERFGVEPAHVRRIESAAANPTLSVLVSVARALGTTLPGLFDLDERTPVGGIELEPVRAAVSERLRRVPTSRVRGQGAVISVLIEAQAGEFWRAIQERGEDLLAALLKSWNRRDDAEETLEAAMAVALACSIAGSTRSTHGSPRSEGSGR